MLIVRWALRADQVSNHCHLTGKFRGAVHNECNFVLQFRSSIINKDGKRKHRFVILIIFQNLHGYDEHFILHSYKKTQGITEKINCIPTNLERYLSLSIDNLRLIDSLQFLNAFIDILSTNLKQDDFLHTRRHSPTNKFHLLLRKVYFAMTIGTIRVKQIKLSYLREKNSSVGWLVREFHKGTMIMHVIYGRNSEYKLSFDTMICIWKQMFCWLTFSRRFIACVKRTTDWMLRTTFLLSVSLEIRC